MEIVPPFRARPYPSPSARIPDWAGQTPGARQKSLKILGKSFAKKTPAPTAQLTAMSRLAGACFKPSLPNNQFFRQKSYNLPRLLLTLFLTIFTILLS
jgi:hypothetical protein